MSIYLDEPDVSLEEAVSAAREGDFDVVVRQPMWFLQMVYDRVPVVRLAKIIRSRRIEAEAERKRAEEAKYQDYARRFRGITSGSVKFNKRLIKRMNSTELWAFKRYRKENKITGVTKFIREREIELGVKL